MPSRALIVREAAQQDLIEAVDWISDRSVAAASELIEEFELALGRIREFPESGSPTAFGARRMPLRRFQRALIYRVDGASIRVIALAHDRREPYWQARA